MRKLTKVLILSALVLFFLATPRAINAQSAITFGAPSHDIDFPDSLSFAINASSNAGEILTAKLTFWVPGLVSFSTNLTKNQVEFSPASSVQLLYIMNTEGFTVFPSTPYLYYWEVTDSAGNTAKSKEFSIRYDDTRYDWDIFENEEVAVWTHDRSRSFGQSIFEIAKRAITAQYPLYQIEIAFQIRIIVYNNTDEFAEWHSGSVSGIGGQADPNIGVTTQIVSLGGFFGGWLNDVIPHEISHLYFAQVTYNPTVSIPNWLSEGVATYNEFLDHSRELNEVEKLGQRGELVPLSSLARGFGRQVDEDRFRLAYSEAVSAVTYMIETYGEDGLADLLAAYKSGLATDDAFMSAFGVDATEFEFGWAAWLGIPEGDYVIPTAWPMPTFRPSPTPFLVGSSFLVTSTSRVQLAQTAATPTPLPPVPEDGRTITTISSNFYTALLGVIGFTCFSVLLLMALLWFLNKRRQAKS